MEPLALKLALLVAVLAAGALGGAVPLLHRDRAGAGRFLGLGNAFAAGVFLGAGFIHMLPDASDAWRELGYGYPMAFLLAAVAFVLLYLIEHVLLPEDAHPAAHAPSDDRFGHVQAGSGLAAYGILMALSVHSFLAGLALGAEPETASALVIFAAILAHKSTAGFALGVSLVRTSMSRRRAWGLLAVFAMATPLGIGVGAGLQQVLAGRAALTFEATFLSLAAGTFAYVATLDILRDELVGSESRFRKWLLVVVGMALMGALALVV